jgi:hypothetical protein
MKLEVTRRNMEVGLGQNRLLSHSADLACHQSVTPWENRKGVAAAQDSRSTNQTLQWQKMRD